MTPRRQMKLSMLELVNRTADARRALQRKLDALSIHDEPCTALGLRPLAITIDGEPQDEAMLAICRPVIEREIRAQIASLDKDLEAYGVEVS